MSTKDLLKKAHALHAKPEQALVVYKEILFQDPLCYEACVNTGVMHSQLGQKGEAEQAYKTALEIRPGAASAACNLSRLYISLEQYQKAVDVLATAVGKTPAEETRIRESLGSAYNDLGNFLRKQAQPVAAHAAYEKALAIFPDRPEVLGNMGANYLVQGDLKTAEKFYDQALAIKPDHTRSHVNRATLWLAREDYEHGWLEYEWRLRDTEFTKRVNIKPLWQGDDLNGKRLLLYAEQGLGDTFHFMRYVPAIRQRFPNATVVFEVQPPLEQFLAHTPGCNRVCTNKTPSTDHDVEIALFSLPAVMPDLMQFPIAFPYIQPDAASVQHWQDRLPLGTFKAGLVWAGNPVNQNDAYRSCTVNDLAPLADVSNTAFFSLQKNQIDLPAFSVTDLAPDIRHFGDTAAIIANLDLVITVDTSVAHLASAMGKPVWLALATHCDWRWGREGDTTHWYPAVLLFRQPKAGDWHSVFNAMAQRLRR